MSDVQLFHGDCLEVMKSIPDGSIDAVMTDPPYNISQDCTSLDRSKFKNEKMRRNRKTSLDYGDWDKKERSEFFSFTENWYAECSRVLKDGGAFISFFSKQDISLLAWLGEEHGIRFRTFFDMIKTNPMPSVYRRNYLSAIETAFVGSKGDSSWVFNFTTQQGMRNYFLTPNKSIYGETDHPCEKPVDLMRHFVRIHTNEGMTVLDPFMGSGTTGVACIMEGRNFIGIESDAKWFETGNRRIEEEKNKPIQQELF